MRVRVTRADATDPTLVRVRAEDVDCLGTWRGQGPPPLDGEEVGIEVTVEDDSHCRWSGNAELVGTSPGAGYLAGRVEQADADGVITLRVGSGLVLVEVPEGRRPPRVGERLSIIDARLTIWPV